MKTVCVIFGGANSEHEVSLRSATSVLENINRERWDVVMLGITKEGRWLQYTGPVEHIVDGSWQQGDVVPAVLSPDRSRSGLLVLRESGVWQLPVDVVFPVMHGKNAEDGTMQGLLEIAGLPYVGSGVLGSALCMDKAIAHQVLCDAGVPKARLVALRRAQALDLERARATLERELGYPMFVKPANAGSSVGVSKVDDAAGLRAAIELALENDDKIVVEQMVVGREIECSVMGNEEPFAAEALGEIVLAVEFYDYDAKYITNTTELRIPAPLPDEVVQRVRDIAVRAYQATECAGFARVDFFVQESGDVILNEINTIPGFTSISMFPKMCAASGIPYGELIDKLLDYALQRGGGTRF